MPSLAIIAKERIALWLLLQNTQKRLPRKGASCCQNVYKMIYRVSPSDERALMLTVLSLLQPMPSS